MGDLTFDHTPDMPRPCSIRIQIGTTVIIVPVNAGETRAQVAARLRDALAPHGVRKAGES